MSSTALRAATLASVSTPSVKLASTSSHPRSALGLRRIRGVEVSQLLNASPQDVQTLSRHLRQWGVPRFRNFPLLLRALTHPSFSNWAERVLQLRKRSLGPNILELLGDRVVGTAVARHVLQWQRASVGMPSPPPPPPSASTGDAPLTITHDDGVDWTGGAKAVVAALVGNKGLSVTAREIGLEQLLRWEKATPPCTQRGRLDSRGVDAVTGIASNVEVNALAAAYEAVAAAVFLDGGFSAADAFVATTLLDAPASRQRDNREVHVLEHALLEAGVRALRAPATFIADRRANRSDDGLAGERFVIEVLDLERVPPEGSGTAVDPVNDAHPVFYSCVALRRASEARDALNEHDLVSVASHFSVANARMAAVLQATAALSGERGELPGAVADSMAGDVAWCATGLRLRRRTIGERAGPAVVVADVDARGAWRYAGDLARVARLLARVGGVAFADVTGAGDARMRLRAAARGAAAAAAAPPRRVRDGGGGSLVAPDAGRLPRRRSGGEVAGDGDVAADDNDFLVTDGTRAMLRSGGPHLHALPLAQRHVGLQVTLHDDDTAHMLASRTLARAASAPSWTARRRVLTGLHALGRESVRLWAVVSAVAHEGQDRAAVVTACEQRLSVPARCMPAVFGERISAYLADVGVRPVYVAVGACAEGVGVTDALALLADAEAVGERGAPVVAEEEEREGKGETEENYEGRDSIVLGKEASTELADIVSGRRGRE